jgi:hypothetical protein
VEGADGLGLIAEVASAGLVPGLRAPGGKVGHSVGGERPRRIIRAEDTEMCVRVVPLATYTIIGAHTFRSDSSARWSSAPRGATNPIRSWDPTAS